MRTLVWQSATYTYTDDYLTKIQTPSTTYNFSYGDFGLRESVSVSRGNGSHLLAAYSYTDDGNNYLSLLDFGNGDTVYYIYDQKGRVTEQIYENGDTVTYAYDNNGALARVTDSASGITTAYYYDFTDRMMKYVESGTDYSHSVGYAYDTKNNLTQLVETINGVEHTTSYTYDDDNRVESVTNGAVSEYYTYDGFGRVSEQTTKYNGTDVLTQTITFKNPVNITTSPQVSTFNCQYASENITRSYTYDDNGNIKTYSFKGNVAEYFYDTANQLIRENNGIVYKTWTWTYDNAGNILTRSEYVYTTGELGDPIDTVTYTYGDSDWGDLLTAYDGNAITYDQLGNPLSDGMRTYTWEHGRQLSVMKMGGIKFSFAYNADGMRTKTLVDGIEYISYVYDGNRLTQMTMDGKTGYFTYGTNGPVSVTWDGQVYYYVVNLQGDVERIVDSTGTLKVLYCYDAWGNIVTINGNMANTLGRWNPLRYRGYVYDIFSGLYYLQSRYYNPEIGRFISADSLISTGQGILGYNMFSYCGNNPVTRVDYSGKLWRLVVAVVVVALTCTSSQNETPYKRQEAREKYNHSNVAVYKRDNPPAEKGLVNAEIYYPSDSKSNINIDRSLDITSNYEQEAILDVIIDSPYYSEDTYGSKSFMQAQWVAHNVCHDVASSGAVGFWIMQRLSGSDNPIQSSISLDLRSMNNLLKRQKVLYTVISWFY